MVVGENAHSVCTVIHSLIKLMATNLKQNDGPERSCKINQHTRELISARNAYKYEVHKLHQRYIEDGVYVPCIYTHAR